MATDYDTPRKTDEELHEESLEELKARRADAQSGQVDIDEAEAAENLELPGADLSGEELTVKVVPKQEDEFTCSRCFLVKHVNQRARGEVQRLFVAIAINSKPYLSISLFYLKSTNMALDLFYL